MGYSEVRRLTPVLHSDLKMRDLQSQKAALPTEKAPTFPNVHCADTAGPREPASGPYACDSTIVGTAGLDNDTITDFHFALWAITSARRDGILAR